MKRFLLSIILFSFLLGCKKTEVPSTTGTTPTPPPVNPPPNNNFVSKTERYSKINETTGLFVVQNNFLRYVTQSEGQSLDFGNLPRYRFHLRDMVTYDFNGDGKLDLFGFCYRFEVFPAAGEFGKNPGKFIVISDFYSGNRTAKVFDTDYTWIAGAFTLNDFNGDGKMEVALFNSNGHQNDLYGANNPLIPVRIYSIDAQFNLTYKNVGVPLSMHSGSTGDVDNDGDVDIIQWPIFLGQGVKPEALRYPYVLLNDGSGNFTTKRLFNNHDEFKSKFYDWNTTVYELFDLNNDNKLDILFGWNFGNAPGTPDPWNPTFDVVNKKNGVLWGDGSGQFDYKQITYLDLKVPFNYWMSISGAGYTDFDKDGDVDVMIVSTSNDFNFSRTYILYLLENKGNKVFEDVTSTYVTGSYELDNSNYTHFYQPLFIDKDGDGDYDMVPNNSSAAWEPFKVIDNLYWEKQGKNFIRRQ